MSKKIKVYLDTNIIILGNKLSENEALIKLSKSGAIKLFISQKVTMERKAKLQKQSDRLWKLFYQENNLEKDKYFKLINNAIKKREEYEKVEKDELKFWKQVKPERATSTFAGLTLLGLLGPDIIELFDVKNERILLGELLENYNIKHDDAFHLMEAHSAEMDYFLTNDTRLIRKSKRVPWLKLKVQTTSEFIKNFQLKNE